jgi:hypothetical protein
MLAPIKLKIIHTALDKFDFFNVQNCSWNGITLGTSNLLMFRSDCHDYSCLSSKAKGETSAMGM